MTKKRTNLYRIITIGLMAALVYVGNYLQIKIPNGVLVTRIHLGNSMCLLAGLLFGGLSGGLSSGIGAALYDLFDPAYTLSAPFTFINKFAMGFTAGILRRRGKNDKKSVIIAAAAGQLMYIVLYLVKTYFTMVILGNTAKAAWAAVGTNAVTSTINAVLAVIISVPLYFALNKALSHTEIAPLIKGTENPERKNYWNPVNICLTIFAVVVTIIFTINLSAQSKLEKAEAEKEQAYREQIDELTEKLDYLYDRLGIDPPVTEEPTEPAE